MEKRTYWYLSGSHKWMPWTNSFEGLTRRLF